MAEKREVEAYIMSILGQLDCKGIEVFPTGNVHCQCPFHRPRRNVTAFGVSFVNEDRGYPYNCLSCGANGNLAQLVSYALGVSYKKALRLLNKNIVLTPITMSKLKEGLQRLSEQSKEAIKGAKVTKLPPRSWNQKPMLKYLRHRKKQGRGVINIKQTINKYGLYYCSDGRMAGRIIMPIRIGGRLVGINDRAIDDNIRNKSLHIAGQEYNELMYGMDEAQGKRIGVLVEGAFDLYQVNASVSKQKKHSHIGVVANMGTAFSEFKAALLIDYFDELVIMFDNQVNDKGKNTGLISAMKIEAMMRESMPVRNVTLAYPEGKDPGICTSKQILKALHNAGYKHRTDMEKMRQGSSLKL